MKKNEIVVPGIKTMSSVELVAVINDVREEGNPVLAHSDFMKKIEKVLGEVAGNFSGYYVASNGKKNPCYNLPKREAELMAMSESYKVQAKVYDRMTELEAAPAIAAAPRTARIPSANREALSMVKPAIAAAKAFGLTGNHAALSANKFIVSATGVNPLELMGATHLIADQRGQTFTPTQLGAERGISGQAMNKLLRDSGAQILDASGNWAPTVSGMTHAEWLDTAKKHSNGAPVKQLKWFATVTDLITAGESA